MAKKKQTKTYKHPKLRKTFIIIGIVLGGIFGLLFLIWGGINTFKFVAYREFYSRTSKVAKIPGLNSGAIPQGITCYDDKYIMSMYMKDGKSPSRLYVLNSDGSSKYVELYEDEALTQPCTRHCGGTQYVKAIDKLYVADAKQYVFEVDVNALLDKDTTKLPIKSLVHVDNEASAIFSDDNYVYVSEFNKEGTEWTTSSSHKITYNQEAHNSYISVYPIDKINKTVDFTTTSLIYSIPDLIQGVAFKDNVLYMTTSWGISSSHLYFYDMNKFISIDEKTKFVTKDSMTKDIKCPPMLEDLDFNKDGKLVTYNESASSKYIFGKFFFANKIYAIKVD